MQFSSDQGRFVGLLVKLFNVNKIFEVRTLTGYSSLVIALALYEKGQIISCDISEEYTAVARRFWQELVCQTRSHFYRDWLKIFWWI